MKHRILITEDDPVTAKYMEINARKLNYEVLAIAESAEQALEYCKTNKPDLVLMDISLPGEINGIEAAEIMINQFEVPVIFVTNYLDPDTLQAVISSHSYGYMIKPVRKEQLYTMVEMTIQRHNLEKKLKNKENELARLNDQLENKVAERTARLIQSKEDLEMFTFAASHELLSPLRFINYSLKSVKNKRTDKNPTEVYNILDDLDLACNKMHKQLEDLLTLSKLGKQTISITKVDTQKLIEEVLQSLENEYELQKYTLKTGLLPLVKGDKNLLFHAFKNIISNALKYSSKKEKPKIEISSEERDDQWILSIRDNGEGFNMNYYESLFKYFERLHSDEEFIGNGLGLSIAERALRRQNADIWAKSKTGEGACFYIALPKI